MLRGKSYWYLCASCEHLHYREKRHKCCDKLTVKVPEEFYDEMFGSPPKEESLDKQCQNFNKMIKEKLQKLDNNYKFNNSRL